MTKTKRRCNLAQGSLAGALGLGMGYGTQYLYTISVSRLLGAKQAGWFFGLIAVIGVAAIFARAGLDRIGLRQISIYSARGNIETVRKVVVGFSFICSSTAIFIGGLLLIFGNDLLHLFDLTINRPGIVAMAVAIPGMTLSMLFAQLARGFGKILWAAIIQIAGIYSVATTILLLFFYTDNLNLESALWSLASGTIVISLIGAVFLAKLICQPATDSKAVTLPPPLKDLTRGSPYMFWISLLAFFSSGVAGFDVLIIGALAPPVETAYYVASARTVLITTLGLTAVSGVVAPMVARTFDQGEKTELQAIVSMATRWALTFALFIAGFLILDPQIVLLMFGKGFAEAREVLQVLLVGQLINVGTGPVSIVMQMTGNENKAAGIFIVVAVLMIVGYALLVPTLGALGAALVTTVGRSLQWIAMTIYVKKSIRIFTWADNAWQAAIFLGVIGMCRMLLHPAGNHLYFLAYLLAAPPILWKLMLTAEDRASICLLFAGKDC